jgi:hypothetical protein
MNALIRRWDDPLTTLSCEIEGHPLGGGMLKLEPREAGRIAICKSAINVTSTRLIEQGIRTLREWRHCG